MNLEKKLERYLRVNLLGPGPRLMKKRIYRAAVSQRFLKKKLERYLRVNLLGPGPRLMKKRIYRAAVSQRLRNTGLEYKSVFVGLGD